MSLTHAELVSIGVRWMSNRYGIALAEFSAGDYIPDVIGFRRLSSMVLECKSNRADFLAELRTKKIHNPKCSDIFPGTERAFLVPKGLLRPEQVPEDWGLLEVRGKTQRVYWVKKCPTIRDVTAYNIRLRADARLLYSIARRTALGVPFDPETGRFQPAQVETR